MDETFSTVVVPGPRGDTARSSWTLAEVLERMWKTGKHPLQRLSKIDSTCAQHSANITESFMLSTSSSNNLSPPRRAAAEKVRLSVGTSGADCMPVLDEHDVPRLLTLW